MLSCLLEGLLEVIFSAVGEIVSGLIEGISTWLFVSRRARDYDRPKGED